MATLPKELRRIEADIRKRLPMARCSWDSPSDPKCVRCLDVRVDTLVDTKVVVIEVTPEHTYGVTLLTDDGILGEKPDTVFQQNECENMLQYVVDIFQPN